MYWNYLTLLIIFYIYTNYSKCLQFHEPRPLDIIKVVIASAASLIFFYQLTLRILHFPPKYILDNH